MWFLCKSDLKEAMEILTLFESDSGFKGTVVTSLYGGPLEIMLADKIYILNTFIFVKE